MSNKRITELPAITSIDNDDLLAVVDVSANVTTKATYGSFINNVTGSIPPGLGASGLGWARYDDTEYVGSGSALIVSASTTLTLPNNGGALYTSNNNSVTFYDSGSQKVLAENVDDVYVQTITFKAKTDNANQTYFTIRLSSTGATPYERVRKDLYFPKGNSEEHYYHEVLQFYSDSDFVANGNQWKITAFTNDVQIYDIIYFIQRTQNHG